MSYAKSEKNQCNIWTHTHAAYHTHSTHTPHTPHTHKTSLQSLAGTVAAVSFADDLQKWHKQLQTIEAVLRVWLNAQQLWVQLEEVGGATV